MNNYKTNEQLVRQELLLQKLTEKQQPLMRLEKTERPSLCCGELKLGILRTVQTDDSQLLEVLFELLSTIQFPALSLC